MQAELERTPGFHRQMAAAIRKAAELFFRRVNTMQPQSMDRCVLTPMSCQCLKIYLLLIGVLTNRVVEWLSFHLSQNQYRYEWEEWEPVLEMPADAIPVCFVRCVLGNLLLFFCKN